MIVYGLDLRHLEIFGRVVQEGGITQAAKSLGLTQPTVSGHIHSLEKEAGTVLLHRGGGRARPTAAGDLLYRYVKQISSLKADAQRELEEFLGLRQGQLKVGASTTPATYYLPPFLARFHEEHPAVELTITVGDTREILDALEEGRIEMAVVGDEVDEDRYRAKKVASDRIVLAVGRGHPWFGRHKVKLDELKGQSLIMRGQGSATLSSVEQALEKAGLHLGKEVPIALRLPTNEAIREAVARGKAAAFLPKTVLAGRDGELRALDIEGMTIERPFTLVLSLSREPGPAAKSLMQMLG